MVIPVPDLRIVLSLRVTLYICVHICEQAPHWLEKLTIVFNLVDKMEVF